LLLKLQLCKLLLIKRITQKKSQEHLRNKMEGLDRRLMNKGKDLDLKRKLGPEKKGVARNWLNRYLRKRKKTLALSSTE
jgi:hypothetical protein